MTPTRPRPVTTGPRRECYMLPTTYYPPPPKGVKNTKYPEIPPARHGEQLRRILQDQAGGGGADCACRPRTSGRSSFFAGKQAWKPGDRSGAPGPHPPPYRPHAVHGMKTDRDNERWSGEEERAAPRALAGLFVCTLTSLTNQWLSIPFLSSDALPPLFLLLLGPCAWLRPGGDTGPES